MKKIRVELISIDKDNYGFQNDFVCEERIASDDELFTVLVNIQKHICEQVITNKKVWVGNK